MWWGGGGGSSGNRLAFKLLNVVHQGRDVFLQFCSVLNVSFLDHFKVLLKGIKDGAEAVEFFYKLVVACMGSIKVL